MPRGVEAQALDHLSQVTRRSVEVRLSPLERLAVVAMWVERSRLGRSSYNGRTRWWAVCGV
jgi:hypothetical protein